MLNQSQFDEKVAALQEALESLTVDEARDTIEETAARLEGFNYTPPVFMDIARFLRCTKEELLAEFTTIARLKDAEVRDATMGEDENEWEIKLRHISVLTFYFKELTSLRTGDLAAWDEVDELYVHD